MVNGNENEVYPGDHPIDITKKKLANSIHGESTEPKAMQDYAAAHEDIMLDKNTGKYYICTNPAGSPAVANPTTDFEVHSTKETRKKVENLIEPGELTVGDYTTTLTVDEYTKAVKVLTGSSAVNIERIIGGNIGQIILIRQNNGANKVKLISYKDGVSNEERIWSGDAIPNNTISSSFVYAFFTLQKTSGGWAILSKN